MQMIEIRRLSFSYGEEKVLSDLSFQAEGEESIGIVGANGVGKSTLLKIMVGILPEYEGEILIGGLTAEKKHMAKIREKVGYVFQDSESQLFMSNVYEDVAFAPRNYGYPEEEVEKRVERALDLVHIQDIKEKQIYRLSGGQKKLASIATILATDPQIILLDEPSVALDPRNRRNLIHIINDLPCMKIIASHDLDMIWDTCDRTILLSDGKIAADGKTKEILSKKELLEENGLELPMFVAGQQSRMEIR